VRDVTEAAPVVFGAKQQEIDRVLLPARSLRRDQFNGALKVEQVEHRREAIAVPVDDSVHDARLLRNGTRTAAAG
jgi:hypothetical protein